MQSVELEYLQVDYTPRLLQMMGLVKSTSEGRRMLDQGAVKVRDGVFGECWRLCGYKHNFFDGTVIQVGKPHHKRVAMLKLH